MLKKKKKKFKRRKRSFKDCGEGGLQPRAKLIAEVDDERKNVDEKFVVKQLRTLQMRKIVMK